MKSEHTDIVYLCDGKACGDNHACVECKHTGDISHAVNFEKLDNDHWFEKEQQVSKDVLVIQVRKNLTHYDLQSFQKDLCKMKESGVVVLPNWCELVEVVDDDTDFMIEEKKMSFKYDLYFDKYCDKCKYKDVDDTKGKAPCHECLSEPTNLYSHVPAKFKEKNV